MLRTFYESIFIFAGKEEGDDPRSCSFRNALVMLCRIFYSGRCDGRSSMVVGVSGYHLYESMLFGHMFDTDTFPSVRAIPLLGSVFATAIDTVGRGGMVVWGFWIHPLRVHAVRALFGTDALFLSELLVFSCRSVLLQSRRRQGCLFGVLDTPFTSTGCSSSIFGCSGTSTVIMCLCY